MPDVDSLPTRLIDVGSADTSYRVKLVETESEIRAMRDAGLLGARYIALSHCWGPSRPACLTTAETLKRNRTEIPWDSLAKTFQDAITVTRALGVRYLWIDSITIIQQDEDDWVKEASRMHEYYTNAYCTIAATWGDDDDSGLFCDRDEKYDPRPVMFHTANGNEYSVHVRWQTPHFTVQIPDWYRSGAMDFGKFPLLARAWVYQERMLSKRFVHFTRNEIMWECLEASTCQCYSTGAAFPDPKAEPAYDDSAHPKKTYQKAIASLSSGNVDQLAREWREIVTAYSRLSLTFGKDKFPALSGVNTDILQALLRGKQTHSLVDSPNTPRMINLYMTDEPDTWSDLSTPQGRSANVRRSLLDARSLDGGTVAGLLRSDILAQLLWSIQQYPVKRASRPQQWRAPSWSWAAVDSPIQYAKALHETGLQREMATYIGKTVITKARGNPFGELIDAAIVLRGRAVEGVRLSETMVRTVYKLDWPGEELHKRVFADASFALDCNLYPEDEWFIARGQSLLVLPVGATDGRAYGLVLEKHRKDSDAFMRVGLVTMAEENMEACLQTAGGTEGPFVIK